MGTLLTYCIFPNDSCIYNIHSIIIHSFIWRLWSEVVLKWRTMTGLNYETKHDDHDNLNFGFQHFPPRQAIQWRPSQLGVSYSGVLPN